VRGFSSIAEEMFPSEEEPCSTDLVILLFSLFVGWLVACLLACLLVCLLVWFFGWLACSLVSWLVCQSIM